MADCINFRIGKAFLAEKNWPIVLSNALYDRCYCSNCYSAELKSTYMVGGNTYIVPRNWTRIGVRMNDSLAEHRDIWNSWLNCYHGTSIENAKSVIEHQMLLLPGEKKMDGKEVAVGKKEVPVRKREVAGEYSFITTPTIKYAQRSQFTERYDFTYKENGERYDIKAVLQCKQKPDSFTVHASSITERICGYIPNEKLKWITEQRTAIMPYGLLLLIKPKNPTEEISGETPAKASHEITCPHCWHSKNVWKNPKVNQGIIKTCENCKKTFQPFNCPHCSCLHVKKELEGDSVCYNDHCQEKLLQHKCLRCSKLNVWKTPKEKQAVLVTCAFRSCKQKFQLHQCPRCDTMTLSNDVSYKTGVVLKCCKSFQLVDCPHCSRLNVCKNAYAKVGLDGIVKCAYESCNKTFQQPLQPRH